MKLTTTQFAQIAAAHGRSAERLLQSDNGRAAHSARLAFHYAQIADGGIEHLDECESRGAIQEYTLAGKR